MKKNNFKILALALLGAFMTLTGQGCFGGGNPNERAGTPTPVVLNYWTVFNNSEDYNSILQAYQVKFPHITVNIQTYRPEDYENALLQAFAEDRGPDIFSIPNNAVRKYEPKLLPMPASTTLESAIIKGSIQKTPFVVKNSYPSFTTRYIRDTFIDQVSADANLDGQFWGLPLSTDVMALYYNKSLLDAAGIAKPAATYQELQQQTVKLTRQDRLGNILQSGVALGTTSNIPRFADILSLLMMQNGTQMTDEGGSPSFNILPKELTGRTTLPAADAIAFYTDFATPTKQVYSWNAAMPNALQAFEEGQVAYFFGYAYDLPIIRTQAPKLNFGITKVPQITGNPEINVANYWLESVSKKSKHPDEAWNFLQFMVRPENVSSYLTAAKRPTAVRSLLTAQVDDLDLGPFAEEVLTAKSWYHGKKPEALDAIFSEMVANFQTTEDVQTVLSNAASKVNQTYQ